MTVVKHRLYYYEYKEFTSNEIDPVVYCATLIFHGCFEGKGKRVFLQR
jgi:hypothetical protein